MGQNFFAADRFSALSPFTSGLARLSYKGSLNLQFLEKPPLLSSTQSPSLCLLDLLSSTKAQHLPPPCSGSSPNLTLSAPEARPSLLTATAFHAFTISLSGYGEGERIERNHTR
jgi:hypothetical protein